ncbi:DNA polymerase III subunit delta' [Chelatococcus sp. SYSU_G07232]|uniref:DNA polymerase III subunit delta n=1 Tax=Chelatococcus albus TaxID=3047466 RepID=A0ABT7ABR8_9HYPH|nr:DNA polymerase III subunit delta' [Chelatococcus sp. SYSU_G07232]MDJ1156793.1 DNA polymerase III subunit delta' [Chelatococcus sp. SYSU_G07232]
MASVAATEGELEADRLPGAPHPRERAVLFGHQEAEAAFLEAYRSGRLHHAWLLGGAEGIGKATFAYRVARFLLAHPDPAALEVRQAQDLSVPANHPVAHKVAALSHPDLTVLRRAPGTEKKGPSSIIPVDAARRALTMFGSTAGVDGYRICIVDSAEDLNLSSANALLKVIEEPPPRSLFLIVAHAPGRTLATIRSRCRRLMLRPLTQPDVVRALRSLGPPWDRAETAVIEHAAALAEGSVRRAVGLLDAETIALVERVRAVLERLPEQDLAGLYLLAEDLAGRDAEDDFAVVLETIADWIATTVRGRAGEGASRLAPLVEVWEKSARAAREAQVLNLDRRPLVLAIFGDLAEAVRRCRAA